jgi:regulator of nonsense transcripts 2
LDSLQKSVETLSDVLVQPLPELEEEQEEGDGDGAGVGLELWTKEGEGEDFGPFDDEETRAFYCDIPDLLTTIPPVLLGMTQDDIDRIQAENLVKYGAGYESVLEEGDSSEEMVASSEADFEASEAEGQNEQPKEGVETGECLLVACVLLALFHTWLIFS